MRKPRTLEELRDFYVSEYRPLYDRFVAEYRVPQELHAEVAAAFDHLMRHCKGSGQIGGKDFDRVVGHLKRATFDSFKLLFENGIRARYDRFMTSRYADVEDGEFQPYIMKRFNEAVSIAREARTLEHSTDSEDCEAWGNAFEKWKLLLPIVDEFIELESSPRIQRAKKLKRVQNFWSVVKFIGTLILGALLSWIVPKLLG
ncbi:MAG: hypothetical protein J6A21_09575 [Lentisphaeria bacterium]|nr:hypothetical protein [Lentisphaeria bacterium]